MSQFRRQAAPELFAYSSIGSAAVVSLDAAHIHPPTEAHVSETRTEGGADVDWGDLRPHHFQFDCAARVRLPRNGRPDVLCDAVSVTGRGRFIGSSEDTNAVSFKEGAVIVKVGDRHRCFPFEVFKQNFFLESGEPVATIYEVGYQTPKK
jgi:hypothetical protein